MSAINGASKVNVDELVPTLPVSTTPMTWFCRVPIAVRHSIVVGVIQAVFAHTLLPTNPVGELPDGPKFVPRIVTTAPDFAGPFSVTTSVMTGES